MEQKVTMQPVSDDLNDTLNHLSGLGDMDSNEMSVILNEMGSKMPTIWMAGCGYCWIEEEQRWVRCCIA